MNRWLPLLLSAAAVSLLTLAACRSVPLLTDGVPETKETAAVTVPPDCTESAYTVDGTTFFYNGTAYDITERSPSVNAIVGCTAVGPHLVIEGHVGPKNGVYSIFNTETESFEKDIMECNLIWCGEDISTAVYSFWEGIYSYDGTRIAAISLDVPAEYIRELAFTEDASLLVTVSGESDDRTERIPLPSEN